MMFIKSSHKGALCILAAALIFSLISLSACASGADTQSKPSGGSSAPASASSARSGSAASPFVTMQASAKKAFEEINATLPASLKPNAAIAIFPMTASSLDLAEMALENLTIHFVNSNKYTVVEKRRVDELLAEYDFQRSGLAGEKTLGELLGADAVIFSILADNGSLNSWAVDTSKRTTLGKSLSSAAKLPTVTGGTNNEAETIASFMAYGKHTSNISSAAIHQIGRKTILVSGSGSTMRSLDYADALELWVKLQSPPPPDRTSGTRIDTNIWSQFAAGVNREEAELLTQLLIIDVLTVPYQGVIMKSLVDVTKEYENTIKELMSPEVPANYQNYITLARQWREYVKTPQFMARDYYDNTEARNGQMQLARYAKTIESPSYIYYFDWSRRGNRTRLDVGKIYMNVLIENGRRFYWRYTIEYGSPQEFLSKMRGLSIFMLVRATSPLHEIVGFDGYDLSTAVVPAAVPGNFTRIKRVVSRDGAAPMGGFHISTTPITQREYESIMKQNPSVTKSPNSPVSNVSLLEAMAFCNQMSIRDGLEPAYLIEYARHDKTQVGSAGVPRDDLGYGKISVDPFANGYRLATPEEWNYARNFITGMGDSAEYIFDGTFQSEPAFGARLEDPLYGGPGPRAAYMTKASSEFGRIARTAGNREYTIGRAILPYEQDLGMVDTGTFRVAADGSRIPIMGNKVRVSPVIRVIRPVFDYWKYTSGK